MGNGLAGEDFLVLPGQTLFLSVSFQPHRVRSRQSDSTSCPTSDMAAANGPAEYLGQESHSLPGANVVLRRADWSERKKRRKLIGLRGALLLKLENAIIIFLQVK